MAIVELRDIAVSYGSLKVLDDINLTFAEGEFFGLLGPSGSGKTTLLRLIAGFIFADAGSVHIDGISVGNITVEKREIGMVFQNSALFPNMSVTENIAFGLRVRHVSAAETRERVSQALALVQLEDFGERRAHQLSGGQKQRVALARAVVTRPRVLLLDEPLSALDKGLRTDMQIELRRIQQEIGITTIFVTHDQEEAMMMSDTIGILQDGRIVQTGPPRQVYRQPVNAFSANFLGEANIFSGTNEAQGLRLVDGTLLQGIDKCNGAIAVRPESMILRQTKSQQATGNFQIQARLQQRIFAGALVTCILDYHGQTIKVLAKDHELDNLPDTGLVWVSWPTEKTISLE